MHITIIGRDLSVDLKEKLAKTIILPSTNILMDHMHVLALFTGIASNIFINLIHQSVLHAAHPCNYSFKKEGFVSFSCVYRHDDTCCVRQNGKITQKISTSPHMQIQELPCYRIILGAI